MIWGALRRPAVTDLRHHAAQLANFYIAVVDPSTSVCERRHVIRGLEVKSLFDTALRIKGICPVPCHPAHQLKIEPRPGAWI